MSADREGPPASRPSCSAGGARRASIARGCAAGLAVLAALTPLAAFNPGFAGSRGGWAILLATGVLGAVSADAIGRRWVRGAAQLWIGLLLILVAAISTGVLGVGLAVAAYAAPFAVPLPASLRLLGQSVRMLAGAILACVALLMAVWIPRPAVPARDPVILIGIDGASWPIIDELRAAGRLPAFDRLITRGTRATLAVADPSISPSLWTSIATGVSPARHGIEDFWASSTQVRSKRIWEIADEGGLVSGVMGYLVTWPPQKRGGFLVPGWLAQDSRTIPGELSFLREFEDLEFQRTPPGGADELRLLYQALRGGAALPTILTALDAMPRRTPDQDPGLYDLRRRRTSVSLWTEAFCHQIASHQPDLGIFYQHHVDAVEHLYFSHYRPEGFPWLGPKERERYEDFIPQIYEAMDRSIERIEHCAPPRTRLVVLSDHGQRSVADSPEPGAPRRRGRQPLRLIRATALLEILGLEGQFRGTTIGPGLYLRAISPEAEIETLLGALRGVVTRKGRPVFRIQGQDGDRVVITTGVRARLDQPILVAGHEIPLSDIVDETGRYSGTHTDEAILLLAGPGIAEGKTLPSGSLLDVAPTVLALLGQPVARDLEGRVLRGVLKPEARENLVVTAVDTYGAPQGRGSGTDADLNEVTKERLRALGYLN